MFVTVGFHDKILLDIFIFVIDKLLNAFHVENQKLKY